MSIDTSGSKEDVGFEGKKQSTEAIIERIIGFQPPQDAVTQPHPGKHHIDSKWALSQLHSDASDTWQSLFKWGSLEIEIYQPRGHDPQQPHWCDEVYFVISGTGYFRNGDDRTPFKPGDVMFVPAGVDHRFEDFCNDFATWAILLGSGGN